MFLKGVKHTQYQFIIWESAPDKNLDKPMSGSYGWKRDCDRYVSVAASVYAKYLCVSTKQTNYIVPIFASEQYAYDF